MSRLRNYIVFHLNLAYSSIEEEQRELVIKRCYWPVLHLAKKHSIQLGIELSGYTLELIKKIDPNWVVEFKFLLDKGLCELIGSGYSQIIGPLIPAQVNDWNQRIGLDVYNNVLGITPKVALINEMAYSAGIIEHYVNNGYSAIIMEWNNPRKYHTEWKNEWRYFPQIAKGCKNNKIPIIWADSIAFQKFQRVIHGDIEIDEYIEYLKLHINKETKYFPLYTNDVEIFDFRPGRFKTEATLIDTTREWNKVYKLLKMLKRDSSFSFIFPSKVLDGLKSTNGGNSIFLESPEQPIPVKKQEKYNINRWAITGRNDLNINTKCYALFKYLKNCTSTSYNDWKELCFLWSSDFRTHITRKRWVGYNRRLKKSLKNRSVENLNKSVIPLMSKEIRRIPYNSKTLEIKKKGRFLKIENDNYYIEFNTKKGLTINSLVFKKMSDFPLIGTLQHSYFDDISLGADFYSGHAIIEQPGKHKISDLSLSIHEIYKSKRNFFLKSYGRFGNTEVELIFRFMTESIALFKVVKYYNNTIKIIRPFHFTFIPSAWDKNSLFYRTHNGGECLEKFNLKNSECSQSSLYSPLISSKYGLGATEGIVDIGDKKRSVRFIHINAMCSLVPKITFRDNKNDNFFLRLEYSAQEVDETLRTSKSYRTLQSAIEIVPSPKGLK